MNGTFPHWREWPQKPALMGGLALLIYLALACFWFPAASIWSPDTGAKLWQLQSLRWENGRFAYDIVYSGREIDPNLQFVEGAYEHYFLAQEGKLYFHRFLLFPMLVWPLWRLLGNVGLPLLPAFCGAGLVFFTLQIVPPAQRRGQMWFLLALGSPVLVYSALFWEHTIATCLVLAGVAWALAEKPQRGQWVGVGVLFAVAAALRQETVLFSGAFLVSYGWLERNGRRHVLLAGLILGGGLWLLGVLNTALFGVATPGNATYLFYPFTYLRTAGWQALPDLLVGPPIQEALDLGWLASVWAILAVVVLGLSLTRWRFSGLAMAALWGTAVIAGYVLLTPQSYRAAHGLLFTTPWALLGLARAAELWSKNEPRLRLLIATTFLGLGGYVLTILVLRASPPHGGLEWGARFALTFYAPLAIFAGWEWSPELKRPATLWLVMVLVYLGIGLQMRGLAVIRHDKVISTQLNQIVATSPDTAVVTDIWWLTFNATPLHQAKTIFNTPDPEAFAQWVDSALEHNVHTLTFVSFNDQLLAALTPSLPENMVLAQLEQRPFGLFHVYRLRIDGR